MSILINVITKTALSVGGLMLFHPLREPATGVTRSSVDSPPQAGIVEAGVGWVRVEWRRGQLLQTKASFNCILRRRGFD